MRPVGLSGKYATPLRCRPWLSSWYGKSKAACGQKLLWCRRCWQHVGRQAGSKVIEFLSDYKLRIRHAWLQLMTGSYTAQGTQQQVPLATSKITVAGACTKFSCHTCVQLPRPPTGWTERERGGRWWCEQISIISSATCAAHLHVCWHA